MQAIVYHRYGTPDVLEYREIEKPVPAGGQVLIQVRVASVNPYDCLGLIGNDDQFDIDPSVEHRKTSGRLILFLNERVRRGPHGYDASR